MFTPPAAYGLPACDSLSGGFYVLGTAGGALLFLLAARFSDESRLFRFSALAVGGVAVAAAALLFVPGCLQSPLADLDPLLRAMWLDGVAEARSVISQARFNPEDLGGFYAVPLIALGVCLWQAWQGQRRWQHLVFAASIAMAFVISLVQVRGSVFANLLAIAPMAALVAEKQILYRQSNRVGAAALQYGCLALVSIQFVWSVGGTLAIDGVDSVKTHSTETEKNKESCAEARHLKALSAEPTGVVSAVSNLGSDILRYTQHRVLSAPYHRNQSGMLTQLQIAMGNEAEAESLIRDAGVTLVAFCPSDPETRQIVRKRPDSLYAQLAAGDIPGYLLPVDNTKDNPIRLYRVVR